MFYNSDHIHHVNGRPSTKQGPRAVRFQGTEVNYCVTGGDLLEPIQRSEPLVNQVYQHLREQILSGALPGGEKIVETHLASELQISRSPVREAIRLLTMEQLLRQQDGAVRVFEPTLEDCLELYDLRLALEPAAVRMAAAHVSQGSETKRLAILAQNIADTEVALHAGDTSQIPELNTVFHGTIWEIAGNTRFIRILDNISTVIRYYGRLVLRMNNQQTNILAEHSSIYQALKEGDGEAAAEYMHIHISKDLEVVEKSAEALART